MCLNLRLLIGPQSDAKDKTLEAIRIERKKLANLANSASQ